MADPADLEALLNDSITKPSAARVYDYWLGGACNWAVDREFADAQTARFPDMPLIAQQNRKFLNRAVTHLLNRGIRQFVDIGSGIPTAGNVHEIADTHAPNESRVVYIDHDPIAHAHSTLLLNKHGDPTRHRALHADLTDYHNLWHQVLDTKIIDPTQPIALLMTAVLHFVTPDRHPERAVNFYRNQLPPNSYLVISHATTEALTPEKQAPAEKVRTNYAQSTPTPGWFRTRQQILDFYSPWPLIPPGLTWTATWTTDTLTNDYTGDPARTFILAGIAHNPT